MRSVYSSPRLENIERVIKLLEESDIETQLGNKPSFRTARFRHQNYRDTNRDDWPSVWIVKSEDLPKAKVILREAGVIADSFKPTFFNGTYQRQGSELSPAQSAAYKAGRVRLILIGISVALAILVLVKMARIL